MRSIKTLSEIFAKNRAEELPDDLWKMFVHPRNQNKFDLKRWTKSTVIVGGRGSGKTMFLKYHCHPTIFSKNKDKITDNDFNFIGIHWRPDTFFTQNISEELLGNNWETAFNSLVSLTILIEFSKLINNICNSKYKSESFKQELREFELPSSICKALKIEKTSVINSLESLEDAHFDFSNWINSQEKSTPPITIDLTVTLKMLISRLSRKFSILKNTRFNIFVDEFENLTKPQQKIVNTWLKHSSQQLIFSIAHKKHADVSRDTKSQEKIVERNDFRLMDLDDAYAEDFENIAAEVFILKWAELHDMKQLREMLDLLSDPKHIEKRKESVYLSAIKDIVKEILPSMKLEDISLEVLETQTLRNKLIKLIESGLKINDSIIDSKLFINSNYPKASIINGALLNRKSNQITPEIILIEFLKHQKGESSKYNNWIQNNLKGSLLYIYNATPNRICPIYAGFDQFILMSRGNLRHFLELCHQAIVKAEDKNHEISASTPIPIDMQIKSTKYTSKLELDKIEDLGANGKYLKRIANRIGILFTTSQARKSQSEPEVNHFSIPISGRASLNDSERHLLNECLVWSVLFEEESTKVKSDYNVESFDYILHPVLSSHFGISPSKKRKLNITMSDISMIINGTDEEFQKILRRYQSKWDINEQTKPDANQEHHQLSLI